VVTLSLVCRESRWWKPDLSPSPVFLGYLCSYKQLSRRARLGCRRTDRGIIPRSSGCARLMVSSFLWFFCSNTVQRIVCNNIARSFSGAYVDQVNMSTTNPMLWKSPGKGDGVGTGACLPGRPQWSETIALAIGHWAAVIRPPGPAWCMLDWTPPGHVSWCCSSAGKFPKSETFLKSGTLFLKSETFPYSETFFWNRKW
jgi:hypothetical protein